MRIKKNSKLKCCTRCVNYLSEITPRTCNLKNTVGLLVIVNLQRNPLKRPQSAVNDLECLESYPVGTSLDLQLSFYRPMCYNSRAHCPLMQYQRTNNATLAGAHSYFVVSSFKRERKK